MFEFLKCLVNPFQSRNLYSWIKTKLTLLLTKNKSKNRQLKELYFEDLQEAQKPLLAKCLYSSIKFWSKVNTQLPHPKYHRIARGSGYPRSKGFKLLPTLHLPEPETFNTSKTEYPMTLNPKSTICLSLESKNEKSTQA